MYHVVFDAVGKLSFRRSRVSLKPAGTYVGTDGLQNVLWALWTRWIGDRKAALGVTRYSKQDVLFLKQLVEAGEYRPVVDRRLTPSRPWSRRPAAMSRRGRRPATSSGPSAVGHRLAPPLLRRAEDRVADLGGAVAVLEVAPCGATSRSSAIAASRWCSSCTKVCSQPIMWPCGHQCSRTGGRPRRRARCGSPRRRRRSSDLRAR